MVGFILSAAHRCTRWLKCRQLYLADLSGRSWLVPTVVTGGQAPCSTALALVTSHASCPDWTECRRRMMRIIVMRNKENRDTTRRNLPPVQIALTGTKHTPRQN